MSVAGGISEYPVAACDGLRMWVRDHRGPRDGLTPAVCLAGLTRSMRDFDAVAERLGRERRVVCVDLVGRGRAERSPDWRRYAPSRLIDDLRHLVVAAGIRRAAFVGTSLGGLLSAAMAVVMPTAVAGVVFNDIGPEIGGPGLRSLFDVIGRDQPQPDWPSAVAFLRSRLPDLPARSDADWLTIARTTFAPGPDGRLHYGWDVAVLRPFLASRPNPAELWPLFRALRNRPCLVLRGERSTVFSAVCFDSLKASFPGWRFATVPAVGHAPSLSEPIAVETLDEFFDRADSADHQRH